jgi:hypothetical protein
MTYIPEESKVIYRSKDDKQEKEFDALEWLAARCSHVPNEGEQMIRYYGYYSPAPRGISRGKRKKQDQDGLIASILEADRSSKEHKRNWTRPIQMFYGSKGGGISAIMKSAVQWLDHQKLVGLNLQLMQIYA